ncbi:hypothetical protein [Kineococcus sp. SYSU DK005]|uniref:hypothetical protein n=1 Tax=Kineococcus sp. SYSU DK005 TaxID=3383126 RepID=UPI003D7E84C5
MNSTRDTEHLVLTTIVKDAEWRADTAAAMARAHERLHQRAQQHALRLQGAPLEEVEVLYDAHRVRITLSAQAVRTDGGTTSPT